MTPIQKFLALAASIVFLLLACDQQVTRIVRGPAYWPQYPHVGQQFLYVRFSHANFFSTDTTREFYADTLMIRVVEMDDEGIALREHITAGSRSHTDSVHSNTVGVRKPENVYYYRAKFSGDSVKFSANPPRLFGSFILGQGQSNRIYGPSYLLFEGIHQNPIEMNGWKAPSCACFNVGSVESFSLNGRGYFQLGIIINELSLPVDGGGFVCLYSFAEGLIQSYEIHPWQNRSLGWARVD